MKSATLLICALISLPAASEDLTDSRPEPSVEILGVKIMRGMPEAEVKASFASVYCAEKAADAAPRFDYCSVSDGIPPDADGDITFKDGLVHSATRNWFIPEDAEPLDVLMVLNDILTRLTGESYAACAKIETHSDQYAASTVFALPDKALSVEMHTLPGRSGALFRESLRVNPVPIQYTTHGKKMQGDEWCTYVN